MGQAKKRAVEIAAMKAAKDTLTAKGFSSEQVNLLDDYAPLAEAQVKMMAEAMRQALNNPTSTISQYTRKCRANGEPCMQDRLDAGEAIEDIIRQSVFVK
jgi:lysyl-tRNA synthetase class I